MQNKKKLQQIISKHTTRMNLFQNKSRLLCVLSKSIQTAAIKTITTIGIEKHEKNDHEPSHGKE